MTRKIILSILAAASLMLCGCSTDKQTQSHEPDNVQITQESKAADAREVLESINNELLDGKMYKGDKLFDDNTEKFYGVTADKVTEGGMLYNTAGSSADEVDIVKFSDDVDGKAVLEKRLSDRRATFDSYKPEDMPKFDKAEVFEAGGYDVLIISEDAQSLAEQIKSRL